MKKTYSLLLVAVLVLALAVSCATKAPEVDTTYHVSTLVDFINAFKIVAEDETKDTIVLDNDIRWDSTLYPAAEVTATGITVDLNGFAIQNIPTNGFNVVGDSFTIKNGSLLQSGLNEKYALCINYNGTNASTTNGLKEEALAHVPAAYDDADPVWAKRVVLEDLYVDGVIICYTTAELKNITSENGKYRAIVMQGSSGIIENAKAYTIADGQSAGLVAHSYGVVTLKGNVQAKGKFGFYSANCATLIAEEGATVYGSGFVTYGAYLENQAKAIFNAGTTLEPAAGKAAIYIRTGSSVELGKGVVVNAETLADIKDDEKSNNGAKDADWAGFGTGCVISDNR